eukprot:SAG31_NODE_44476_length_262_cov_1.269939_1_plen_36_part_01
MGGHGSTGASRGDDTFLRLLQAVATSHRVPVASPTY